MSKQFRLGENIIPAEHERDQSKFTPSDSIVMPPSETEASKPLPKPDAVTNS